MSEYQFVVLQAAIEWAAAREEAITRTSPETFARLADAEGRLAKLVRRYHAPPPEKPDAN